MIHAAYEDFAAIPRVEDHGNYVGRHRLSNHWGTIVLVDLNPAFNEFKINLTCGTEFKEFIEFIESPTS